MKKILVILAHPDEDSFSGSVAERYLAGAKFAGHEVELIKLGELKFDPILYKGYKEIQELEPDLKLAQKKIKWADHLVWIFPNWWGSFPAILKGFIDRVMLPGFAFKYKKNSLLPEQFLKNKSARIIVVMDSPIFIYNFYLCSAGVKIIKKGVLKFCGISPVKTTKITRLFKKTNKQKEKILQKIEKMGKRGK